MKASKQKKMKRRRIDVASAKNGNMAQQRKNMAKKIGVADSGTINISYGNAP